MHLFMKVLWKNIDYSKSYLFKKYIFSYKSYNIRKIICLISSNNWFRTQKINAMIKPSSSRTITSDLSTHFSHFKLHRYIFGYLLPILWLNIFISKFILCSICILFFIVTYGRNLLPIRKCFLHHIWMEFFCISLLLT